MKKYAVVDLMGGFGNQIFQYSFGKELSNKGFKVSFDSSNYCLLYTSPSPRDFG